jgi:hypothetical protein
MIFGFLGVVDTKFINLGGTMRIRYGVDRDTIMQPGLASVQAQFQPVTTNKR